MATNQDLDDFVHNQAVIFGRNARLLIGDMPFVLIAGRFNDDDKPVMKTNMKPDIAITYLKAMLAHLEGRL